MFLGILLGNTTDRLRVEMTLNPNNILIIFELKGGLILLGTGMYPKASLSKHLKASLMSFSRSSSFMSLNSSDVIILPSQQKSDGESLGPYYS